MPCDTNSGFHLRVYFRVAFFVSSAGHGWEGHQYQLVNFFSSRPEYFVPTLMQGVIDVMLSGHAVHMPPYAMESSLCDAMEIPNNFLGYHPCPPKRKTE